MKFRGKDKLQKGFVVSIGIAYPSKTTAITQNRGKPFKKICPCNSLLIILFKNLILTQSTK